LILISSQIPAGTCRALEVRFSDHRFAYSPENLRLGKALSIFMNADRIILGVRKEDDAKELEPLLTNFTQNLIAVRTESAEMIKHASNAFLAMKISFINAVASICESVGANVQQVCDGIGTDSRIGPRFLNPGIGYGGSCFPKDLMAFRSVAKECGYDFRLLDEVIRINEDQRHRFLRKVRSVLWTLRGKRLGVLGLAFKGGTDDIRESPAILLVQELLREGCHICAHDPAAMDRAKEVLNSSVVYAAGPYEAAAGADALLILTEWEEFAALDLDRLRKVVKYPIVIDGRNLYDPAIMSAHGFSYYSVGRPATLPEDAIAETQPNKRQIS